MNNTDPEILNENRFARPVYLMCKPAGATCNLACEYCYYLEKSRLYDAPDSPTAQRRTMTDAMLETYIRRYIEAVPGPDVLFTWHGGETLLRPIEFYERAIELQRIYGNGRNIDNCIQTNGTMLNERWCRFFRRNGWLVGISIDGPEEFHDEYRRNRGGQPTFRKVMGAIRMLQAHGVEWNALAVVNDYNADYPEEFYRFFKSIGCKYLQFTPIVERMRPDGMLASGEETEGELTRFSVTPEQWGDFLCRVYNLWVREDVGKIYVQLFDSTLANWVGVAPGICTLATTCGHAAVMEYNGDVYSCDHFVFPAYRLGNLNETPLTEMMQSERQIAFGNAKRDRLPGQCRRCRWLFACNGECPKNRISKSADGEPGLNYLCEGYRRFFEHVAEDMDFMRDELAAHRPPANIMDRKR
ncbi:MAG: anaerobic sulfatase-maturation protein [Clostridium sp.]|nr:anaerobic sulfatase-maturation protein [Clostridium sp.]